MFPLSVVPSVTTMGSRAEGDGVRSGEGYDDAAVFRLVEDAKERPRFEARDVGKNLWE